MYPHNQNKKHKNLISSQKQAKKKKRKTIQNWDIFGFTLYLNKYFNHPFEWALHALITRAAY